MINYTYTDADASIKRPIEPGEYATKITSCVFGMAKTGTDKLDITLSFPEIDSTLIESIYFTAKSQWKFDLVLKCFAKSKGATLPAKGTEITINEDFVNKFLLGAHGRVTVEDEEYPIGSGSTRSRVKIFHPSVEQIKMDVGLATQQAKEETDDLPF